jgi:hypothetical protein
MPPTVAQLRAARLQARAAYSGPRVVFGIGAATADAARGVAIGEMGKHLRATAAAATQRAFEFGKQAGAGMVGGYGIEAPASAAVAEFVGPVDGRTCPLCRYLVGSRFAVGSAEFFRYQPPVHINCRHVYAYFEKGAPGAVADFRRPPEELVRKHGHFVSQPAKYEAVRVPATPTGRDFILRRVKDADSGEIVTRLDWLKAPDEPVTRAAREALVQTLGSPIETTAAGLEEVLAARDLGPLVDVGWLQVVESQGPARTVAVAAADEAAAREAFFVANPLARVQDVTPSSAGDYAVVYTEGDGRRIQLTARGRKAALVEQERAREAERARQPRLTLEE